MDPELLQQAFARTRIVGASVSDYPETPDMSETDHHVTAIRKALDDAGLELSDVDGLLSAAGGRWGASDPMSLSEYLGIRPTYVDGTSVGGSSFVYHAARAAFAVASGLCEVAVITHGQKGRTGGRRGGGGGRGRQAFGSTFWDLAAGQTLIAGYAFAARRHMHEFGTTSEDLAQIAVATRGHAALNPKAQYRDPITVDDVLSSRWVAEPLHLLDCCVVSDGGGAFVITSADRAKDLPKPPVRMLGYGERLGHARSSQMPDFTQTAAVDSGRKAFDMAGLKPGDIDCAQLYDSFTITVLLALEDLGFCPKGEGADWLREHLRLGGPLPINTDGGGLSACHPGMRGMFLVIEAVRQIRGEAEDPRTLVRPGGVDTALVHGVGGQLSSHATLICGRDG